MTSGVPPELIVQFPEKTLKLLDSAAMCYALLAAVKTLGADAGAERIKKTAATSSRAFLDKLVIEWKTAGQLERSRLRRKHRDVIDRTMEAMGQGQDQGQ